MWLRVRCMVCVRVLLVEEGEIAVQVYIQSNHKIFEIETVCPVEHKQFGAMMLRAMGCYADVITVKDFDQATRLYMIVEQMKGFARQFSPVVTCPMLVANMALHKKSESDTTIDFVVGAVTEQLLKEVEEQCAE